MNIKSVTKSAVSLFSFLSLFLIASIIILSSFSLPEKRNQNYEEGEKPSGSTAMSTAPQMPEKIDFCGEKVPLENFYVKERLDRELIVNKYYHSSTILVLKRSARWFPVIEKILKENGIPEDFKYLSVIESNLENAVSHKGATGFWQFMKAAGKRYGLEINSEIDERYHVEKSTLAACKYLKDAYKKFGSWTLAAASYNRGMNGIRRQIKRQKAKNYYNLVLPEETSRYVFRIIALKDLFKDPSKYGYYLTDDELYKPIETYQVKVKSKINHWADFAKRYKINYKTLKLFNPWIRDNKLTNKRKKTYRVKIPEKGAMHIIKD
ncbi:MAG: lytic transglycosylase domain-containing protein [Rhodothermaceae bacterium]